MSAKKIFYKKIACYTYYFIFKIFINLIISFNSNNQKKIHIIFINVVVVFIVLNGFI